MKINIDSLDAEQLLEVRMCDLDLKINNTIIEDYINELYSDLSQKGMSFHPPCYLSDEWFSPLNVAAIAIPFYLAHPRLIALEKKMMRDVEGGSHDEALRLLRHECGHAYVHAFNLTRKRTWHAVFGHPGKVYNDHYRYRPYSKSFVHNLKDFYAQSHPEEDFAETFAVWLNPKSDWEEVYHDWPAFRKLEYVKKIMNTFKDETVKVYKKDLYYNIKNIKKRLFHHYERKKKLFIEHEDDYFDSDLKALFPGNREGAPAAAKLIKQYRRAIENAVCRNTKETKYVVSGLMAKLVKRMKFLGLKEEKDPYEHLLEFTSYVTALSGNYRYTNRYRG